jgi:class 3 adenylate cyclase
LPYVGDSARVIAEIREFLAHAPSEPVPDFSLATVLCIDCPAPEFRGFALDRIAEFGGVARAESGRLAVFDGPARAVRCALAIMRQARSIGVDAKAGLHTGEIALADKSGAAIDLAAEVAALAGPHEVVVSSAVRNLVAGSGLGFAERPGSAGELRLYAAVG